MKSIKRYIISFVVFLLIICGISGAIRQYIVYERPNANLFNKNINKHILVLGDSQLECGIDEDVFKVAFNRCKSSDSYLFCYAKLKKMFQMNPQIDVLLLSFSSTSMRKDVDTRMHTEGIEKRLLLYAPLLTKDDLKWFSCKEIKENIVSFAFPPIWDVKPETRGGFNPRPVEKIHLFSKNKKPVISNYRNECAVYYLRKIVQFCKQKKIKLFFVTSPTYNGHSKNRYWIEWKKINYPYISLFNFEAHYKGRTELFYDQMHLNTNGAKIFSKILYLRVRAFI